jgi:hypothetical protein
LIDVTMFLDSPHQASPTIAISAVPHNPTTCGCLFEEERLLSVEASTCGDECALLRRPSLITEGFGRSRERVIAPPSQKTD